MRRISSMCMTPRTASRGFTLVELMIVVAVVAILAAIAYPTYQEQVRKSRRAQAKADLVEYAQAAERFYTVNHTYVDFHQSLPAVSPREAGAKTWYVLSFAAEQSSFSISATAQDDQARDRCGDLSLDHQGGKQKTGDASLGECW